MLSNNWCGIVESFSMYSIWPVGKTQNSWFSTRHLGINHGKPQTPLLHYASGEPCDEETNKTVEWSDEWTSDLRNKASSVWNNGPASENGRFLGHMCHEWRWIRSHVSEVTLSIVLCGRIASGFSQYELGTRSCWCFRTVHMDLNRWIYSMCMYMYSYLYVYVYVHVYMRSVNLCIIFILQTTYAGPPGTGGRESPFQGIFLGITKIWINHEDLTWPHGQNCLGSGSWLSNVVRNFPVKARAIDW